MRLVRVFPRKTKATPDDELAYFDAPGRSALPDMFVEADEVHIDCTFTYDRTRAESLADSWKRIAPTKIGGVAYGDRGEEFVAGRYIKRGYVFTSRGCPRKCWFCSVPGRDPVPRLLPIQDGWNILDDNLLATPRRHVEAVFAMLRRQGRQIQFTGGLEAKSLKDYQVGLLADLKPRPNMFWAYDPGDEYETLASAAKRLIEAGFTACSHRMRCYVLCGYVDPKTGPDSLEAAEKRMRQMLDLGFTPFAMLWRPEAPGTELYQPTKDWMGFRRRWARPAIIHGSERKTK